MPRRARIQTDAEQSEAKRQFAEDLLEFMIKHKLDYKGLALITRTAEQTVRKWVTGATTPPGTMVALLVVLIRSEEAREVSGVNRFRNKNVTRATFTRDPKKGGRPKTRELVSTRGPNADFDEDHFLEGPVSTWDITLPENR